ncbi:xin actin-binding repeat-containing protein 2-like isoform X1 [Manduca sexta]|uniref:xin actin-binding repeat-containing protein 2-like isoform X1 n=1 Tax=Manduca sexta TaxID=7130 RepID=UPI0018903A69|nr:xin actin-binding repeat-containing protein 2-like isoform X1 [Manduca sexta]
MSHTRNTQKLNDRADSQINRNEDEGEINCNATESCTYAVTVSKKPSASGEEGALCSNQKSFISIHSTDQLCQLAEIDNPYNLEECNVEVLSLNEVFPSTSEESLSNDDETPVQRKKSFKNKTVTQKAQLENTAKSSYVPTNSKSSTGSRQKEQVEGTSVYSDFDIPKSTLYVVGSNPGEPKMSYPDPPKKISKTMKKFLRNIDKHKCEQNAKNNEKAISKLTTMRGILKDGRCGPECTGDSVQGSEEYDTPEDLTLPFQMDYDPRNHYVKQSPDKNVTFNTQVVIIHFTGDLCVGQSVETLSKEKDQQARNSELRKTFLTKYNEFWPTQK